MFVYVKYSASTSIVKVSYIRYTVQKNPVRSFNETYDYYIQDAPYKILYSVTRTRTQTALWLTQSCVLVYSCNNQLTFFCTVFLYYNTFIEGKSISLIVYHYRFFIKWEYTALRTRCLTSYSSVPV